VILRRASVELERDDDLGFYIAPVRVEGRALGARGMVVAELGPMNARCRVDVVERDDGLPDLRIEFSDEEPGAFRAYFDPPNPVPTGPNSTASLSGIPPFGRSSAATSPDRRRRSGRFSWPRSSPTQLFAASWAAVIRFQRRWTRRRSISITPSGIRGCSRRSSALPSAASSEPRRHDKHAAAPRRRGALSRLPR
jgi:hypothetical protein